MKTYAVAEILGDGISAELSASVQRVERALPFRVDFRQVDLSLEHRTRNPDASYADAKKALAELRVAIKYPTVTAEESANRVLREFCDFSGIHRPVTTLREAVRSAIAAGEKTADIGGSLGTREFTEAVARRLAAALAAA